LILHAPLGVLAGLFVLSLGFADPVVGLQDGSGLASIDFVVALGAD
jgi:hypothetical protein